MVVELEPQIRAQLSSLLARCFPDGQPTPEDLTALAAALQCMANEVAPNGLPQPLAAVPLSAYATALAEAAAESQTIGPANAAARYYWIRATHQRKAPDGFAPFVGELAMARVTLPTEVPEKVSTAIGAVEPEDHLMATVHEVNQKISASVGYSVERVDLVTPPRQGARFGAISAFLCYRGASDATPSCYVLEAGTAMGEPKVLYLGRDFTHVINDYSGYQPTPFACKDHAYDGRLTLQGDDPAHLWVRSRRVVNGLSMPPYIQIDVEFTRQTGSPRTIWPGLLIARAAAIVIDRELRGVPRGC